MGSRVLPTTPTDGLAAAVASSSSLVVGSRVEINRCQVLLALHQREYVELNPRERPVRWVPTEVFTVCPVVDIAFLIFSLLMERFEIVIVHLEYTQLDLIKSKIGQ